jgi:predicted DNA-binding transcriptional regulator AlpA
MSTSTPPTLLSLDDFTRLLGLSRSTVRRRIKDGSFKKYQPGGSGKTYWIVWDPTLVTDEPVPSSATAATESKATCATSIRSSSAASRPAAAASTSKQKRRRGPTPDYLKKTQKKGRH